MTPIPATTSYQGKSWRPQSTTLSLRASIFVVHHSHRDTPSGRFYPAPGRNLQIGTRSRTTRGRYLQESPFSTACSAEINFGCARAANSSSGRLDSSGEVVAANDRETTH